MLARSCSWFSSRRIRAAFFALLLASFSGWCVAAGVTSLVITEFMASNSSVLADGDGEYSDWIELYNPTTASVALAGCYLTDDATKLTKWVFPASAGITVPAQGYCIVFASGKGSAGAPYVDSKGCIHTSFKLSADGESVVLVATDGTTIISSYIDYQAQQNDVAYGLGSNSVIGYLKSATPGAANSLASAGGVVADTNFSVKRGFYTSAFSVTITCDTSDATIRYTLDGSTPTSVTGTTYTAPIPVSATTTLRAMAYKSGWFSTDVDTQTYIFLAQTIAQPATRPTTAWPTPTTSSSGSSQKIDYEMDPDVTGDSRYSALMDDALLAVPTISLVTDLANLFNTSTGIYMNPESEGDTWERPACIELINPDGSDGFHANCGIRIRGGVSAAKSNPKHSFRVIMKSDYGDSKIEYPLLGADGPTEFDKIDFRTAQNFSWNLSSPQYATWLDDPFSHDTMRDMGHPSTEGFFFHLYLNGVYWGLYQIEERPCADFCAAHLGGNDDDYDVVKSDEDTGQMYATDGTIDQYNAYWTLVNSGVSTAAAYFKLQGKNADGTTTNTSYSRYLDADNLADYMLLVFYTGGYDMPLGPPGQNSKPRNLYAIFDRVAPGGFKYLPHDNEWSLMQQYGVSLNRVSATVGSSLGTQVNFNPWWLHSKLKSNAEYALHFADRVHRHCFNGGALTASACVARYQARIDEINLAIIAESARWGDYLSSSDPRTRDDDWLPAVTWVRDSFLNASPSTRTAILLTQLKSAGLYPAVAAPEFSQQGGIVDAGFAVTVTAAAGTIYYTRDGSDPRQVGGAVGTTAASGSSGLSLAISATTTLKARAYSGGVWSALSEVAFTVTGADKSAAAAPWRRY
jgi:hypothetical protein